MHQGEAAVVVRGWQPLDPVSRKMERGGEMQGTGVEQPELADGQGRGDGWKEVQHKQMAVFLSEPRLGAGSPLKEGAQDYWKEKY